MSPQHEKDPLEGLGEQQEKFYKLDQVVFAEPIKIEECIEKDIKLDDKHFTFLEKITIEKRVGRRNKYHIEIDDTTTPRCPEVTCNREFSSLSLLRAHIRRVHCAQLRYVCEQCGALFKARYLLMRHTGVHEDGVECPVCEKILSKRTSLSVHLRSHSNTRSHKCTTCGKCFVRKCTLNVHMKVHDLKCGKCGQGFSSRSQLDYHTSVCTLLPG